MIQYAGVTLLLADLEAWHSLLGERHQPLEDLRLFGAETQSIRSMQQFFDQEVRAVTYPSPPRLRLNSLFWPTGATRWSRGVFLATDAQLNEILSVVEVDGVNTPAQLAIGHGTIESVAENDFEGDAQHGENSGFGLSTEMYLLQPRPIADLQSGVSAWLLPLVDVRYYWQYRFTAEMLKTDIAEWDDLFNALSVALDITSGAGLVWDSVSADYGHPSPELMRGGENAAMLLDAAARSVGQRVVRQIDGTVYSYGNENALAQHADNLTDGDRYLWRLIAGGDFSAKHLGAATPDKVKVQFRNKLGIGWDDRDVQASSLGYNETTAGFTKTFHTIATSDSGSTTMANRIATDYYIWLQKSFDFTYAGIKYWKPSGFEDYVEWMAAVQHIDNDGSRKFIPQTRVVSMPPDAGLFDLYHESSIYRQGSLWRVHLTSQLDSLSTASATVDYFDYDSNAWVDTGATCTVRDGMGLCDSIASGSIGLASRVGEADFVLVALACVC